MFCAVYSSVVVGLCVFIFIYIFFLYIYIYMNIYTVYHISTTWVVELWAVLARKFSYNGGILLK